ncbi:nicotinamide-nucleotide amidase [Thiothrix nivea]|uniref:CinA domain protein n=1 Tax=Thiothrix nivea (strain ATCC 35100 / DSM 5205 / JP2) TaxID=870187 RepID=A0A656HAV3_THINJ|nr:nicotinamide-nucleotide amidase [Thiothrix nivea]EIJ33457.1 CinA domain protein [Thiothrix nivea DSM 5205]
MWDELITQLADALQTKGWMLATAESCTGGWIAKVCTDMAGSSAWFERGFVTYSNAAKQDMLDVQAVTLANNGAVSEAVTAEMAAGALSHSRAQVAVSVSGIAGPGGGTPTKPVGTVCFGWAMENGTTRTETCHFDGDREAVRQQSVEHALRILLQMTR